MNSPFPLEAAKVREIAHDLNNALAIVVGYAQLLEAQPDLPPHLARQMGALSAEALRAAQQTDTLLQLARDDDAGDTNGACPNNNHSNGAPELSAPLRFEALPPTNHAPTGAQILVVDDEEPVITLIAEILAADGHRVTPAFNGAEAIAWTQTRDFDLIISDVRMPAVGGPAFFDILQTVRPDLLQRVLFVTGDTVSTSTRQFLQSAHRPVLAKPFEPDRLRRLVRETLQAS